MVRVDVTTPVDRVLRIPIFEGEGRTEVEVTVPFTLFAQFDPDNAKSSATTVQYRAGIGAWVSEVSRQLGRVTSLRVLAKAKAAEIWRASMKTRNVKYTVAECDSAVARDPQVIRYTRDLDLLTHAQTTLAEAVSTMFERRQHLANLMKG